MKEFPHDWCVCDEERGWWICQIENRFADPGDGEVYQAYNLTVLKYAGDGLFSSEEDAYNPANFAPVVKPWIAAKRKADAGVLSRGPEKIAFAWYNDRSCFVHERLPRAARGVACPSKSATASSTRTTVLRSSRRRRPSRSGARSASTSS